MNGLFPGILGVGPESSESAMKPLLLSSVRSGLIALGLVAGLSAPSLAGPMSEPLLPVAANAAASDIVQVRDSWAGGNDQYWRFRNNGWQGGDEQQIWRFRNNGLRQWQGGDER